MRFALLHEGRSLEPTQTASARERFQRSLQQSEIAEQVGFHSVWLMESRVAESSSVAAAPEIWLSAVAAHTRTIRIGQGVPLGPYSYHNPIRTAEMSAVLDILSQGRLELGSTSSVRSDGDTTPPAEAWDEALRMLPRMWTESGFSWDSPTFKMPACDVHPKPIQDPHPPLWMSGGSAEAAVRAGERGLGYMHVSTSDEANETSICVTAYREAIARAEPIGDFVNERFAAVTRVVCESSTERRSHARPGEGEGPSISGDPEQCIREIETAAADGIDMLVVRSDGAGPEHHAFCDKLRLIGREVIPHFAG